MFAAHAISKRSFIFTLTPPLCVCVCVWKVYEDPHKPLPSLVVHIRGLVDGITESDVVEALREFGTIRYDAGWNPGVLSYSVWTMALWPSSFLSSLVV